jgi:hypothetical protein
MTHLPGETAAEAQRWWRAYQLAGSDQVDELRRLTAAGDEHARRQLASWLSDRAYTGSCFPDRDRLDEAIEVIRPLADAGDDVAELWLARWLADCGHLEELRQRADRGGYHASRKLARTLAGHDMLDELRARAGAGSYPALEELAEWLASREHLGELRALLVNHREQLAGWLARGAYPMRVVRLAAELGDDTARRRLRVWLTRLRERADSGDEHAREFLAENPDWQRFQAGWA